MKEEKKRIYLSLPISGYDINERRATAEQKKHELESLGFEVVNPLDNGLPENAGTHAHMKRDFEMLLGCDAIFMMRNWLRSAGCKVEFDVATASGLEVYMSVPESDVMVKFQ